MPITGTYTVQTVVGQEIVEVTIEGRLFRSIDHHLITDRAKTKSESSPASSPSLIPEPPVRKRKISKTEANLLFGNPVNDTVAEGVLESHGVTIREHLCSDLLEYLSTGYRRFGNIRSFIKEKVNGNDRYAYQISRAYLHYLDSTNKIQELIQPDGEKSYTKLEK